MKPDALLNRSDKDALLVKIETTFESPYLYGIVSKQSSQLVLFRTEHDFRDDGWHIIPRRFIGRVSRDRQLIYCQGLMNKDKLGPAELRCPDWLELTDLNSTLDSLRRQKQICIVESDNPATEFFLIGLVTEVTAEEVAVYHFDGQGQWEKRAHRVAIDRITSVRFDDPYSTVFARHLPPPPKTCESVQHNEL